MFKIVNRIPIWGEHDEATTAQIQRRASDEQVAAAALMCDGHKGYSMPIGGVVAYRDAVSPSGVGYDISCGNKAARTDIRAEELKPQIKQVMDQIARTVVFGVGQTSGKARDHELFDDPTWRDLPPVLSIDIEPAEAVYDLEIAHESHAFICEGMVVHNCWKETHSGEDVYVVRKGATPAWPGQRGFIGGSMGDISVVVEGVASDEATAALHSTVHGAGRVMSRTQAAGKRRWVKRDGRRVQEVVKPGKISREMMTEWLKREGVELRGAGTDESPHVYRRLPEVLAAHAGSIRVLHRLRPLGVAMASEAEWDPYKD